jgi:methionine-rich copper-binding protein CopC
LKRTKNYGSKHLDERGRAVAAAEVSADGRRVTLRIPEFEATWCYSLAWRVQAADGSPVNGELHGTMH